MHPYWLIYTGIFVAHLDQKQMRDSWKLVGLMLIRGVEKSQLRHALLTIIKYLLLNRKNSCNWMQVFCVTSGTTPCWLEAAKEINRKPKHCYTGALSIARSHPAHRHKLKPWVRASKRQTLPPWFRQLELQLTQTLNVPKITKRQTDRKP